MDWASKDLQDGGLRNYMNYLALARRGFTLFLLASRTHQRNDVSKQLDEPAQVFARITPNTCILTKLGTHGYQGQKFKQVIAEFSDVPFGKSLTTLNKAFINIVGTCGDLIP